VIVRAAATHDLLALGELDGSWEQARRNPTAAAFLGLLMVGVIYYNVQAILGGILVIVDVVRTHSSFHGKTFVEQLKHMAMVMKAPMRIAVFITQFLCMLIPTLWIVKRWHSTNVTSYLRLKRVSIIEIMLAVVITLCVFPLNEYIGEFFIERLHVPDFLSRINAQIFTSYSREELLWLVVVVCVTPAICEEVLFRGYVQRTLERKLGIKSIFITGVIFGLYHMQPINLISLSLLGILFGFFFYRSQSVFPGMAAHFTNNLLAVLALYKTPDDRSALDVYTYLPTLLGVLVALCVAGMLLMAYYFTTQRNLEEAER
jgi:uncharacterized protein